MIGTLRWLIGGASIAVGLVLVVQLFATASDSRSVPVAYGTRQITMTAGRYDFSPKQVAVNESDTVRLVLASREVIHRFQLLDFGVDLTISPGTSRTIDVQADRQGIYRFFWTDLDGANPSPMAGVFIVQARPE